ncbi:peptidylprolyl isomerase [Halobacteriovorax sp.]|uniref:peptidylprolyl isomerase n=1 Tax=Halobacteriovorax sp. TaxID=2020862 RepID=UPI00356386EB
MHKSLARYRARHILLEDIDDAEYVLEKLATGEDFAELAKDLSECNTSAKGGDLGLFVSGQVTPEVERAIYHLEINQISEPIQSEYGFHIIQRLPL